MNKEQAKKKFPSYFENFVMPEWAREQELEVYRACATQKADRESFLNSFEKMATAIPLALDGGLRQPKVVVCVILASWEHGNLKTDTNIRYSCPSRYQRW